MDNIEKHRFEKIEFENPFLYTSQIIRNFQTTFSKEINIFKGLQCFELRK